MNDSFDGMDAQIHDHTCYCGGQPGPHQAGAPGCLRHMAAPALCVDEGRDLWDAGGQTVTGFVLREQRGYFCHPCGCWSSHDDSVTSLDVD